MTRRPRICYGILLLINVFIFGQNEPDPRNAWVGSWVGKGKFYNMNFQAEVGSVAFEIEIATDYTVKGNVGNAVFENATLKIDTRNKGFSINGSVQGTIFPGKDFHKECLILLLKAPENNHATGSFHLKSNCFFDLWMRPGEISLRRIP